MTKKELEIISDTALLKDNTSDLLNGLYVDDLQGLIPAQEEAYTFQDMVKAILKAYALASLRKEASK